IRTAKRLIGYAESGASDVDVLVAESREQAALLGKPEQMEVIAAEFGKRPAVFK
ncbi:MAG TPA: enoyl-CoA hydratase, partial [Sulfitobacter sp.]|nr:enoyl-CoA hydratase [Sulfitobacter sp.]